MRPTTKKQKKKNRSEKRTNVQQNGIPKSITVPTSNASTHYLAMLSGAAHTAKS